MPMTIQVSQKLKKELAKRKMYAKETYEEVIWNLTKDTNEIDEETKEELAQARKEIKEGKYYTLKEVKKELGI